MKFHEANSHVRENYRNRGCPFKMSEDSHNRMLRTKRRVSYEGDTHSTNR
ncbi:hypothetical protein M758_UG150200 [Ceratodon purpureus]|nr:hypothetical protein M758_UG150200 [Ceratodon purpureus]